MLQTRQFDFEDKELLWQSLSNYRKSHGNFADYVIGRTGEKAGCDQTISLDKALAGDPRFEVLYL